jgi:hypothetical protein
LGLAATAHQRKLSIDQNAVSLTNVFDNLGRVLSRAYPDGGLETFGYTNVGLIAYTNQLTNVTRCRPLAD